MRRLSWGVMAFLAIAVSGYALYLALVPGRIPDFLLERAASIPWAVYGHLLGGAVALAAGAFQVNARLRSRYLNAHRLLGRVYVGSVTVGGVAAFALATGSMFGMATHIGFGLLAVLWVGTAWTAFLQIRAGDRQAHRRWMIRSYALTLAAVTLRIYLPLSQIAGIPFEQAYQTISWLCWVPNLIVAEWFLLRPADRRVASPAPPARTA